MASTVRAESRSLTDFSYLSDAHKTNLSGLKWKTCHVAKYKAYFLIPDNNKGSCQTQ